MASSALWFGTRFDPQTWDFRVYGLVASPLKLDWKEFNLLPKIQRTSDFHCVTRWSRFDNRWDGVAFRELLARVRPEPEASYVLIRRAGVHSERAVGGPGQGRVLLGYPSRRRASDR